MKLPSELTRMKVVLRPFTTARYFKANRTPKLQIGCGGNVVPGWLNGDKFDSRADIYLNAYHRLPFPDECFEYLYCEHLLEHIAIDKVRQFLSEMLRVTRRHGLCRLTVPDLELFATKYLQRDDAFFRPYLEKYQEKTRRGEGKCWIVRTNGAAFITLANLRFFHHRWMYDFDTIRACGEAVGFSRAIKQRFRHGLSEEVAALDRAHRESETLYVDLVK